MIRLPYAILLTLCAAVVLSAQEPPPPEGQTPPTPMAGTMRPGVTPPSAEPQPYEKVITKDAKSKKGIFTVHQIKEKYYYEIPKSDSARCSSGPRRSPRPPWESGTATRN